MASLDHVVNVASIPQRSPFRYPGGKTWLVPHVRRWLDSLPRRPALFVEPFAGGGIVSLTVAAEDRSDAVLMVELDADVSAVWQVIIDGDAEWLAREIASFDLTLENVRLLLAAGDGQDTRSRAFSTIVRNRVLRGGILAPGSGLHKQGENGKGLASRWYPETLRRRILAIAEMRDKIEFRHGDGIATIRELSGRSDVVFFIDPPYTAGGKRAGKRLYVHNEIDHAELFRLAAQAKCDVLMTYDDAPELRRMADEHGFETLSVSMKSTHHARMHELLIGQNLDWARQDMAPMQLRMLRESRKAGYNG